MLTVTHVAQVLPNNHGLNVSFMTFYWNNITEVLIIVTIVLVLQQWLYYMSHSFKYYNHVFPFGCYNHGFKIKPWFCLVMFIILRITLPTRVTPFYVKLAVVVTSNARITSK